MHAIPQGSWSDVDPGDGDERGDREAATSCSKPTDRIRREKAGAPYDPFAGVTREQLSTGGPPESQPRIRGRRRTRGDGGEPTFIWERATAPPCRTGTPTWRRCFSPSPTPAGTRRRRARSCRHSGSVQARVRRAKARGAGSAPSGTIPRRRRVAGTVSLFSFPYGKLD